MNSKPVFHLATKKQIQHIKAGVHQISPQIWECLGEESLNIYVRYDQFVEIYLVSQLLERKLRLIKDYRLLEHTGIYFGFLKVTDFLLSLEGAEYIRNEFQKKKRVKLRTITVSEEGTKSFLYGNTLQPGDFILSPKTLNRKDVIFVLNQHSEFIGIGYIFKREDKFELRNLVDYGYYIRRGF